MTIAPPPTYSKIDPVVKARWTAALRSGNYSQGHGRLVNHLGRFCCLGVACHLAGLLKDVQDPYTAWGHGVVGGAIPGLDKQTAETLAEMNDEGADFDQIAAWIDEHL
jgi:hypothetical protein